VITSVKQILSRLSILVILFKYFRNYMKGTIFFLKLSHNFAKNYCFLAFLFVIVFLPYLAFRYTIKKNIKTNKKIPEMQYTLG